MGKYLPTIGIETHVQLRTKTKLFSAVDNDARNAAPNSLISHIDVGLPGALPVLNKKAVELAVLAGLTIKGSIQKFSRFDRKHYFYPDLPKGYQITQYDDPLVKGGAVEISVDGKKSKVGITRIHLEEDAGKTLHPSGTDYSLVDLNRAGTPLIEIVSQPDIHSPAEAKAYARELYLLMKYAGVSDCDLYHGHMRFDVNVSLSANRAKPGTRAEIKNLNSFRSVENAIIYEIKRQSELLDKGGKITQETRGWDEAKQKTTSQRSKEEAEDYRYMPEPDIPPLELTDKYVEEIRSSMPVLPSELRQKLNTLAITPDVAETLLDMPLRLHYVLEVLAKGGKSAARQAAFWSIQAAATTADIPEDSELLSVDAERVIELGKMVDNNQLSSTSAKRIYDELAKTDKSATELAQQLNLLQVSDHTEIAKIVDTVLAENPKVAADIKAGQDKAIAYLIGQVMAKSKGQANPAIAQQVIKRKLSN